MRAYNTILVLSVECLVYLAGQDQSNLGQQAAVSSKDVVGVSLDVVLLEEGAHVLQRAGELGSEDGVTDGRVLGVKDTCMSSDVGVLDITDHSHLAMMNHS